VCRRRRRRQIDTSRPLEFPATPEVILDYHRAKPFLNNNEEWLIVELNEFECLVDGIDILRIIAKHSKFFEVRTCKQAGTAGYQTRSHRYRDRRRMAAGK